MNRVIQEEDILIFDVDNKVYLKDLDLPPIPEPAATVLLENLNSLLEKKEVFAANSNASREQIVLEQL